MTGPVLGATAFVASSVEFVEAATIVMAAGFTQGWRAASAGALSAAAALACVVGVFGPLVAAPSALAPVRLVVGALLVIFGMSWLRKAVWRYAGRRSLRDETAVYRREVERLGAAADRRGFAVAFQGVFVEGLEVAAIVIALGSAGPRALGWSLGGACVALLTVTAAAVALHRPLSRVPENAMKALVGVMLCALGTLWSGEAMQVVWWFGDATLLPIAASYAAVAACATVALRRAGAVA